MEGVKESDFSRQDCVWPAPNGETMWVTVEDRPEVWHHCHLGFTQRPLTAPSGLLLGSLEFLHTPLTPAPLLKNEGSRWLNYTILFNHKSTQLFLWAQITTVGFARLTLLKSWVETAVLVWPWAHPSLVPTSFSSSSSSIHISLSLSLLLRCFQNNTAPFHNICWPNFCQPFHLFIHLGKKLHHFTSSPP